MSSVKNFSVMWCDERCFKPDHESQRAQLSKVTKACGGEFISCRKAGRFSSWLDTVNARPGHSYRVIASWREAKPCFLAMTVKDLIPDVFVVLCESPVFEKRASKWATSIHADFPLQIVAVSDVFEAASLACMVKNGALSSTAMCRSGVADFGEECSTVYAGNITGSEYEHNARFNISNFTHGINVADSSATSTSGGPGGSCTSDCVDSDGGGSSYSFGEAIDGDSGIEEAWANSRLAKLTTNVGCTLALASPVQLVRGVDGALTVQQMRSVRDDIVYF